MSAIPGVGFHNRWAIREDDIPILAPPEFRAAVIESVAHEARLLMCFGYAAEGGATRVLAILADDARARLHAFATTVSRGYAALTPDCPSAHVFERELAEQCGVVPEGHPWLKPLRRHPPDHAASAVDGAGYDREAYVFERVAGSQVHEVAVGPVHAGIIEPGHFRFQAHGEEVLFLEVMLGYQHRGIERLLESQPLERAVLVAESIAGDTVIGHAEAFCAALEALARCQKSPYAQTVRGIALELERLANHIGDLGALAGDVAFAPAAALFGRLRGDCLNVLLELSGNRFGRGLVRPGGIGFEITPDLVHSIGDRIRVLEAEFEQAARALFENESVRARFEGVGAVSARDCLELGFVGPVARACGVARDVRHDHPFGIYRFAQIPVATAWAGDVAARALIRRLEIGRSLEFVQEQLRALPVGRARVPLGSLRPRELAVALTEGWRGEIVHAVLTDGQGGIRRAKVKDPSFHNWSALALAMQGNQISDFPLCNKSFNLSYAGHDL